MSVHTRYPFRDALCNAVSPVSRHTTKRFFSGDESRDASPPASAAGALSAAAGGGAVLEAVSDSYNKQKRQCNDMIKLQMNYMCIYSTKTELLSCLTM